MVPADKIIDIFEQLLFFTYGKEYEVRFSYASKTITVFRMDNPVKSVNCIFSNGVPYIVKLFCREFIYKDLRI